MARTRILVVDDEPDILELVQYSLRKDNYDVIGERGRGPVQMRHIA
jgi:DNA-binding response OmpR family regulator